ncbi:hypothetical protein KI387_013674 [Taxus chinensis]|uniref:Uncharacterized protein n=1 Tax=Taxus chinensis TaxID=29808 RepID=A0AA38CIR6_TAXCH|nr:hypothetical protein KI387_013674 [Taxus chinensis]
MEMEFEGNADSTTATGSVPFVVDILDWRAKGNQLFAQEDWKGAIACYSKYTESALTATKNAENYSNEETVALLYAYSNQAEARLRLEDYGNAVEDCDKALQLHSAHLKSIYRKGRALHGLCEYNLASHCFQHALHLSPASNEIKSLYRKSKKLGEQNRAGKFDLSTYFLRGCSPQDSPEVSNYMGSVVIEKSPGRGRGLFATKNVDIGDILIVENAVAACSMYRRAHPRVREDNEMSQIERLKNETVARVISCAMSSPRLFQQLHYLISVSDIPDDMELFQINKGNWKNFGACKNLENLQLETDKLGRLMELNGLLTHMTQMKNSGEDENGTIWTGGNNN